MSCIGSFMDIKDFKSGCFKQGYKYQYFLPEKINHDFSWQDPSINALLEEASLHLGELNSFSSLVPDSKSTRGCPKSMQV